MPKSVVSEVRPRFSHRVIKFNPDVDIQEVEQFGFVNLGEAFEKGIIPGGIDLTDESFNGCQNPGTLISRNMDVFDGLRKADYVKSQLSRLNAEEREKAENALKRASERQGIIDNVSVTREE